MIRQSWMGPDELVRVEGVAKKHCRSFKRSLWYGIRDIAAEVFGQAAAVPHLRRGEFWSLDGVSLQLRRGEVLGIIGPNGAGKSTLLKLVSGLIKCDAGRIGVRGRVGAMIQLGAGFHPLLTGRENIFVNGAVLGMSRREVARKFEAIVEFSGLAEFIDTPVMNYSSGMYVRLGFAVAVHMDPDVLLIDEVLSVGDFAFHRKCLQTVQELVHRGDKAVIFVSHQMFAVEQLCTRVIWLDRGRLRQEGTPHEVIRGYHRASIEGEVEAQGGVASPLQKYAYLGEQVYFPSDPAVSITDVRLRDDSGRERTLWEGTDSLLVEFIVRSQREDLRSPYIVLRLLREDGLNVWYHVVPCLGRDLMEATRTIRLRIPRLRLATGTYVLSIRLLDRNLGVACALPTEFSVIQNGEFASQALLEGYSIFAPDVEVLPSAVQVKA